MSLDHASEQALNALLERAQAALEQMLRLLADERALLEQRQTEGLQAILDAKVVALQELEAVELERRALVAAAGCDPTNNDGMSAFLALQADPELTAAWEAFVEALRELQAQNDANGRIVNRSLMQAERDLTILSGQIPGTGTYDPKGKQGPPRSREIDRA